MASFFSKPPLHIRDEQTKLLATLLNNAAAVGLGVGFVTPLLHDEFISAAGAKSVVAGIGAMLLFHGAAHLVLLGLSRPE
jgi:hypothetical protein